ncbi:MAG TPA: glycerophosphodiester phosphodiesterase family protein [Hyphomonadaceae bacterium]|nr:glycerophosphodiester phosphodiesterase family protein [Hyphomonadaceae bacterium]
MKLFDPSAYVYAHRGLWGGEVPENSLAAFHAAADAHVGVELDVRLTGDGLPVVFHDKTLERMCDDPRRLESLYVTDLPWLKLPDGSAIPTLEEVLDIMADQPVLIELKIDTPDSMLAETVAALIAGRPGRMTVMSFDEQTVARLCHLIDDRPIGLLIDALANIGMDEIAAKARRARAMGCDYLAPHFSSLDVAAPLAGGLPVVTWTIRDSTQLALSRKHQAAPIFEGFNPDLAKSAGTPI